MVGGSVVAQLKKSMGDIDTLVVAGDLAVGRGIPGAIKLLLSAFNNIIFVPGNHEYYGSTRTNTMSFLASARDKNSHFHHLKPGNTLELRFPKPGSKDSGEDTRFRFKGGTLWFKEAPGAPKENLNDFHVIRDLEKWVYKENEETVRFLKETLAPGDIVVTHHLPSFRSVPEQYKDSALNPFFVCDMEELILERKPALWIHGHTHGSCDYMIGSTRVVCNPFGYTRVEENPSFNFGKVIEL